MLNVILCLLLILSITSNAQSFNNTNDVHSISNKLNIGYCYPVSWFFLKSRVQLEYNLSTKKSISLIYTHLSNVWNTKALGVEFRNYNALNRRSKSGCYFNVNYGYGSNDTEDYGRYSSLSAGVIRQMYFGKKNRLFYEVQFGGRAGYVFDGDIDLRGGFGGAIYMAGPISFIEFRSNIGYRFNVK